jgi:protein involved in polysaccharide export with SLBB domain
MAIHYLFRVAPTASFLLTVAFIASIAAADEIISTHSSGDSINKDSGNVTPADSTQETTSVLMPGDELLLLIPSHPELSGAYNVDVRGFLVIDPAEPCLVAGLTCQAATETLIDFLHSFYRRLDGFSISILRRRLAVRVEGLVKQPGDYTLPYFANLEDALFAAGGISEGGLLTRIAVFRADTVLSADIRAYRIAGNPDLLPRLLTGDRIHVPVSNRNAPVAASLAPLHLPFEDPNVIHVIGAVQRGGTHAMHGEIEFLEALALAGGPSERAELRQIRVIPPQASPFTVNLHALATGEGAQPQLITAGTTILVYEQKESFLKRGLNIMGEIAPLVLLGLVLGGK